MNNCLKTFNSQIAYTYDNKIININNYNYNKNCDIYCENKHKLCFINSNNKRKHFRHVINENYNNLWHKSFQDNFDNIEVYYQKKSNSKSSRNADILLNNNIIELQHSNITLEEVNNRNYDYGLYNLKVIWIIDGNSSITIKELNDNTYLLKFKNNLWKFESFINCEYIYLDIDDKIYKINPQNVKSNMIKVLEFIIKEEFISLLKSNKLEWNREELPQTLLYYNQRGAGCGKTFESIQLLASKEEFQEKNLFIYLTKIHSAKDVIYNEFEKQIKKKQIIPEEYKDGKNGNQYKINLTINKRKIEIIIGTIDSFIYALGDKSKKGMNFFDNLLISIKDEKYKAFDKNGNIDYSRTIYKMNKECLIIIDEAQDLEKKYIEAIIEIMKNTYIDVYLIGDKLQSIWFSENVYTHLEENNKLQNIKIITNTGENKVRRFHNNQFIDFVNDVIEFKDFKLPKISGCCDGNCEYKHENNIKPYYITNQPIIYNNDYAIDKVLKFVDNIIEYIENKVNEYNYLPNNFMFIFPIMKDNYLANILNIYLNEYWSNKFINKNYQETVLINNDYWKNNLDNINNGKHFEYSFIHKSDDTKPINLKESEYSTRLLTIHSSKGLGCEVVFLLNLNQKALEILSKNDNDKKIIYNSLLHVAITRQKKFIYIGINYDNEEDDIYKRFYKLGIENEKYDDLKDLSNKTKIDNLTKYITKEDENKLIKNYKKIEEYIKQDNINNELIDWGHHILRYNITYYELLTNIYNDDNVDNECKKQIICKIYRFINKKNPRFLEKKAYFKQLLDLFYYKIKKDEEKKDRIKNNELNNDIYILENNFNDNLNYSNYSKIVMSYYRDISHKIENELDKNNKLPHLCPIEILILIHFIKLDDKYFYSDIKINDIYSIFTLYENKLSVEEQEKHCRDWNCKCNKHLNYNNDINKDNSINNSIINHYNIINTIKNKYDFYKDYVKLNIKEDIIYNINHNIKFEGNNNDYILNYEGTIIGNSKENIILIILQPQLSSLNIYDIIIGCIFKIFILKNQNKNSNNYKRFNDKKIKICLFTFTSNNPIIIDEDDFEIEEDNLRVIIKNNLYNKYNDINKRISKLFGKFIDIYQQNKGLNQFMLLKQYSNNYKSLNLNYLKNTFEEMERKKNIDKERINFNKNTCDILNERLKISLDDWIDKRDDEYNEDEFI
jgi:hypothetical protein